MSLRRESPANPAEQALIWYPVPRAGSNPRPPSTTVNVSCCTGSVFTGGVPRVWTGSEAQGSGRKSTAYAVQCSLAKTARGGFGAIAVSHEARESTLTRRHRHTSKRDLRQAFCYHLWWNSDTDVRWRRSKGEAGTRCGLYRSSTFKELFSYIPVFRLMPRRTS